ncbi:MAG: hypothetical protein L6R40_008498 [Gallowayella cf. fulva]|nr:MAG: hypothetical protein L6R40_008498 [Xanthomendoza cf. fulva]
MPSMLTKTGISYRPGFKTTNALEIPRRNYGKYRQHASDLDPWIQLSFKVNSFTFDEWLPQDLSNLEDFSIGEEQSPGTVVALSWSPVGLAKHKRSALAILTTNHILSLWASSSDLAVVSSWERVLVINKSLEISSLKSPSEKNGLNIRSPRHPARIRNMSWASPKFNHSAGASLQDTSPDGSRSNQYLVVANDADDVVALQIQSPWSHRGHTWGAQVITHASWERLVCLAGSTQREYPIHNDNVSASAANAAQWPSMFASCMSTKTFIDQVTCISRQSDSPSFGLILRKDRQTLQFHLSYDDLAGASPTCQWMPLFYGIDASPCPVRFPSLDRSAAATSGKHRKWTKDTLSIE